MEQQGLKETKKGAELWIDASFYREAAQIILYAMKHGELHLDNEIMTKEYADQLKKAEFHFREGTEQYWLYEHFLHLLSMAEDEPFEINPLNEPLRFAENHVRHVIEYLVDTWWHEGVTFERFEYDLEIVAAAAC